MAWVEDRWRTRAGEPSERNGLGLRWRVRYDTPDGAERSKSFARKPDAERYRSQVDADLIRGTYLDPDAGKITVRRWCELWLEAQTCDESTRESFRSHIKHITAGLGGKTLAQLGASPSAVQAWVKGLPLAPSTAGKCIHTLSTICEAAIDDGRMARNPVKARSVKAPRVPERKVQPLEADQLEAVRIALPPRFRAMADAGAGLGLRQGELFALAKEDVDFLHRKVHVRRQVKIVGGHTVFALPKRGKTREIPLSEATGLALSEHIRNFPPVEVALPWHGPGGHRQGRPEKVALLFTTTQSHNVVSRQPFNSRVWRPATRKAGLPPSREFGIHILRHTFASVLVRAGVDIKRVASFLGHDDPGFTLRVYTHLMKSGDEDVRRAVDSALSGPTAAPQRQEAR